MSNVFAKGAKSRVLIAIEATEGLTPTTGKAFLIPFNKSGLSSKADLKSAATITGRRDPVSPIKGNIDVGGDLVIPLDTRILGVVLLLAFGNPVTTETVEGSGLFKHVFKVKDDMPSATFEQGYQDVSTYAQFTGCKVSKLAFSVDATSGELTVTVGTMGMRKVIADVSMNASPTVLSLSRLISNNIASVMESGVSVNTSKSFSLNIDFGLDGDTYFLGGGGYRNTVLPGMLAVDGEVQSMFKSRELLDKAQSGVETSLKVKGLSGDHYVEFYVPEVKYSDATPSIDGPKGIGLTLKYTAYHDNDIDDSVVVITIVNDIPSYV